MKTNRKALGRMARWALTSSLGILLLAGGLTWAGAIPGDGGVISACYNKMKGDLRVIDPATTSCNERETAISWGQAGPPGIDGTDGTDGTNGTDGIDGQDGLNGTNGVDGRDGNSVLNGTTPPDDKVGTLGDFYLDTETSILYGPKSESGWGEGTSLIGPAGADGVDGTDGSDGAPGASGSGSPESLEGTTCRAGQPEVGIFHVTFDDAGVLTITCEATTRFGLTVTKSGSGNGTVTSDPPGINCGATCTTDYLINRQVTLTASPLGDGLHRFGGWSGACSGAGPTCTVTMDAAKSVDAEFVALRNLHVLLSYPCGLLACNGQGKVLSNPAGIDCRVTRGGADIGCDFLFDLGTSVTLSKSSTGGSQDGTWGGACEGVTTNSCTLVMNSHQSVRVDFF